MNFFNNNNNNIIHFNNINGTPQMTTNESYRPMYKLHDIVYPVTVIKADSGITFNNSPIIPPSRERPRDQISSVPLQTLTTNPNPTIPSTGCCSSSTFNIFEKDVNGNGFGFLGQDLSLQIMQQQLELDRVVSHHMERMKMEMEQRKKNQLYTIMATMEESLTQKNREKEEELSKIVRINYELEEKIKTLNIENQIWRDLAQTNEETANALRTNLEQTKCSAQPAEAISCCGSTGGDRYNVDDGDSKKRKFFGENGWIYRGKNDRLCRKCGEGVSSVLILPCRHLCVCAMCADKVNFCPVCCTVKNGSVHVNFS